MKRRLISTALFFLSLTVFGCIINPEDNSIVKGVGTIKYLDLEGGFYGIIADNGEYYDPINLPSRFEKDGLRVWFKGKIRGDLGSFHMWGTIIELIAIEEVRR